MESVGVATLSILQNKARWGREGGLGGKNYKNAFPSERLGPPAPAEGFPFPPE